MDVVDVQSEWPFEKMAPASLWGKDCRNVGVEARKFVEVVSVVQDLGHGDLVALTGCGNVPVEMYLPVNQMGDVKAMKRGREEEREEEGEEKKGCGGRERQP